MAKSSLVTISRHYFAEVLPRSLCSSDVFVMIKMRVLLWFVCLFSSLVKSNRYIVWLTKWNPFLSMKVKHLVWKNHTSSSMILGYVVYNIVCSHSTAVENDRVYMLIITFFCLWCLFVLFLIKCMIVCGTMSVSFCLELMLAIWLCLTNRNTLSVCCVWFV